jgi:hypothetical protein
MLPSADRTSTVTAPVCPYRLLEPAHSVSCSRATALPYILQTGQSFRFYPVSISGVPSSWTCISQLREEANRRHDRAQEIKSSFLHIMYYPCTYAARVCVIRILPAALRQRTTDDSSFRARRIGLDYRGMQSDATLAPGCYMSNRTRSGRPLYVCHVE